MGAVLVAISIPIFSTQLNKAKWAVDEANARSIYAQLAADYLTDTTPTIEGATSGTAVSIAGGTTTIKIDSQEYKFQGKGTITITVGTGTTPAKVEIDESTFAGNNAKATFASAAKTSTEN